MKYIRIFGCKAYVRVPREDICKDWSNRTKVGFLVEYSETLLGWIIYIPDTGTCITSVHVRFNEDIPDYRIEYFQELKNEMILEQTKDRNAEDYLYLVGTKHIDDEDLIKYVVTGIGIINNGHKHIIAYRSPIFLGLHQHHKSESVHVADVERMYAATLGTDDLRGGGIPGDGLSLEGSVAEF